MTIACEPMRIQRTFLRFETPPMSQEPASDSEAVPLSHLREAPAFERNGRSFFYPFNRKQKIYELYGRIRNAAHGSRSDGTLQGKIPDLPCARRYGSGRHVRRGDATGAQPKGTKTYYVPQGTQNRLQHRHDLRRPLRPLGRLCTAAGNAGKVDRGNRQEGIE